MRDEDIDTSDIPELGPQFFKTAIFWPGTKQQITLRLDPDVLAFFRKQGKRYQTTINAVLRQYMEAQNRKDGTRRRVDRAKARKPISHDVVSGSLKGASQALRRKSAAR